MLTQEQTVETTAPTGAITVQVISEFVALRELGAEWRSLVVRCDACSIFQTFEWNCAWWEAFGAGHRPLVLLARVDGRLVGIAPLMLTERRTHGLRRRSIEFIGTGASDYADFIIAARGREHEVLRALQERLFSLPVRWDQIHLLSIPEWSVLRNAPVDYFRQTPYKQDRRIAYNCPAYLFGDADADHRLARKKSLRRHYNYFARTGRMELRHCATLQETEAYLGPFFDQHIRRRALTDAPSAFHDERQRAFFHAVARGFLPHGWLRFAVLLFDDRPIAFHFGFEYDNKLIWYKPSFEPSLAEHSPGEVLIKHLIEDALARGIGEFDFTIGDEAFKYRFANHVRRTEIIRVFRHAHLYYLDRALLATRARVMQSPQLARWARKALRLLAIPQRYRRERRDGP